MYDWSEGGETEVVAEDIERLNMDYFDKYDKQQKDWRLFKEVGTQTFCSYHTQYTWHDCYYEAAAVLSN